MIEELSEQVFTRVSTSEPRESFAEINRGEPTNVVFVKAQLKQGCQVVSVSVNIADARRDQALQKFRKLY